MLKGHLHRTPEHAVDPLFLDRWSPRAMSGEPISQADLMVLFEAARWAPSSYNNQPWRMLYARRDTPQWPLFLELLEEENQVWARNAAALVLFVSKTTFDRNNRPSITHTFDAGAAWENFALQGMLKGLVIHGMQGFDYERARVVLAVPPEYRVEAMAVVGKPGEKETLPPKLQERETPNTRKPLSAIVCEGPFHF